jgi:hypothetical protein
VASDFRISVSLSPGSDDHEVRYFADGRDLIGSLWSSMLGLDPDDVLTTPCPLLPAGAEQAVTVARCACGVTECGSCSVVVREAGGLVEWLWRDACVLSVDREAYVREVERALGDFTWETPDRAAARFFKVRFDPRRIGAPGFSLQWASGRVRKDALTASFDLQDEGAYQVFVHVAWRRVGPGRRPVPPAVAADDLLLEVARDPRRWTDVEWSPMEQGLDAPRCVGLGWRPRRVRR